MQMLFLFGLTAVLSVKAEKSGFQVGFRISIARGQKIIISMAKP